MIRLECQATARCKPEHVWQVFADVDRWSQWNPVIGKSHWISGEPWKLDSKFFMEIRQPRRMTFKPVVNDISTPNRVSWTGHAVGFTGTHGHEFTQQADGTTLVKTWEEFSGFATLFFSTGMKKKLIQMYAAWLDALSREAEQLAQTQGARK